MTNETTGHRAHPSELERAEALLQLARRARASLIRLSDEELLRLVDEHRWAVGRISAVQGDIRLRAMLNSAVLVAHSVFYHRPRVSRGRLGAALSLCMRSMVISAVVMVLSALLAAALVVDQPTLAYALVPRELLAQINSNAWGARGGSLQDLGMTFFYWGNNLRASLLALSLGVLGGVPALLIIAFNGALLGATAAVATLRGVEDRLLGWIAPHGVPELSALVMCGGIGLELGRSWLVPGSQLRRAALARAARVMLPLLGVGTVLVLCAAPLEGFVAPLLLPWWLDASMAMGWALLLLVGWRRAVRPRDQPRSAPAPALAQRDSV